MGGHSALHPMLVLDLVGLEQELVSQLIHGLGELRVHSDGLTLIRDTIAEGKGWLGASRHGLHEARGETLSEEAMAHVVHHSSGEVGNALGVELLLQVLKERLESSKGVGRRTLTLRTSTLALR